MSTRAILYARVSGDDHDEASKLDAQIGMCREYAGKQGYTILHEFQEDKYSSGADLDLPHLNEVLELARDSGFDVLVCRELDRLARDLAKQLFIEDELKRSGVRIEYALERYDDSPEGGLMKHVRASVAEYERLKIRERTKRGLLNKVIAGNVYTYGLPPYGYAEATVDDKRTLQIVPEEAAVVREVFDLYLNGDEMGVNAIAKHLTSKRVPTRGDTHRVLTQKTASGYAAWHHGRITRILRRSAYRGKWLFGKHWDEPIQVDVPAIVSAEVWKAAEVKLAAKRRNRERSDTHNYLLRGLAYCTECGGAMRCIRIGRNGKKKYRYHYYRCSRYFGDEVYQSKCNHSTYYPAETIDADLWEVVKALVSEPDRLQGAFRAYRSSLKANDNPVRKQLEQKQKQLTQTERKLDMLLQEYLDGELPQDRYRKQKSILEANMVQCKEEAAAMIAELKQGSALDERLQTLGEYVAAATRALEAADKSDVAKRGFLRRLGVGAEMSRDNANKYVDWAIFSPGVFNYTASASKQ